MSKWTTVFSSSNAATIYGLPETKEEPESETGRKYKYAGKEGVMVPWHLPFLQPMASYSIQQLSVVWIHRGSVTSWLRKGWISILMKTSYLYMMVHLPTTAPLIYRTEENTELKKLPPYSPFLNIVEQSICVFIAPIIAEWNTRPLRLILAAQRCNNKWTIVKKPGDKGSHKGIIELSSCYKRYSEMSAQ